MLGMFRVGTIGVAATVLVALVLAAPAAASDLRWQWTPAYTAEVLTVGRGGLWRCRGLGDSWAYQGERFFSELRCRRASRGRAYVYPIGYDTYTFTRQRIAPGH